MAMNLDDFRSILGNSGVDIWTFIETAITVASLDYGSELKDRRDGIVRKLYTDVTPLCRNCDYDRRGSNGFKSKPVSVENRGERESSHEHESKGDSPMTPVFGGAGAHDNDDDAGLNHGVDDDAGLNHGVDDELRRILTIKERIEDPRQSEASIVDLLQSLADVDITFNALKESDIGRHVNRLRKHPSNDVRRLVKQLVRKWKDLVDEWVRLNNSGELQSSALVPKNQENGHPLVPDFGYSPNPHNGSYGSSEQEPKAKTAPPRRDPPLKPSQNAAAASLSSSAPPPNRQREVTIDAERLASARKRLQENYQEAQNARKQRTIQVMDIHEIPKPKNAYFARNKGGFHGRH